MILMNEHPQDRSSSPERRSSSRRLSQALRKIGTSGRRLIERGFSNINEGNTETPANNSATTNHQSTAGSPSPLENKIVPEDPSSVYSELSSDDFILTVKPNILNRDVSDLTFGGPPPNGLMRVGSLYRDDDDGRHIGANIPRTALRTSVKSFGSLSMSDHVKGQRLVDLYGDDESDSDDENTKDQKQLNEYDRMIASFSSKTQLSQTNNSTSTPASAPPPGAPRNLYEEDEDDETTLHSSDLDLPDDDKLPTRPSRRQSLEPDQSAGASAEVRNLYDDDDDDDD